MKALILPLAIAFGFSAQAAPMPLKYSPDCVLAAVAAHKRVELKKEIPIPAVFVSSQTPLKQFQDAVESQWGMRPEAFSNIYLLDKNEIYLVDEEELYKKRGRFVDDSLAHELAHYVQVKYQGADLNSDNDFLENDAVATQTWFRETFMLPGKSPCEVLPPTPRAP